MLHSKSTYFYKRSSRRKDRGLASDLARNYALSGYSYAIPAITISALLLGMGLAFNPISSAGLLGSSGLAYAVDGDNPCQNGKPVNGACEMELGLTMDGVTPNGNGYKEEAATGLSTENATFRDYSFSVRAVDTEDGYKLYATALANTGADGTNYTNKLVNMDDPEESVILPIEAAEGVLGSAIPAGQWGYAYIKGDNLTADPDTLTYKAVPTGTIPNGNNPGTATPIDTVKEGTIYDSTTGTHTDMNYKLYFGARVADGMKSGHYRTQVQLSLVAEPKKVVTMGTMQTFTTTDCSKLTEPVQLIDDRTKSGAGQKIYWISKIGSQCMMTQNLDLDIPADGLKAEDTDLNGGADWNASSSVKPVATLASDKFSWGSSSSNYNDVQSYDPGEYIINDATGSWTACSTTKNPAACNRYAAITTSTPDVDLHYAVGNYYSWEAATAGTGAATATGAIARDSICPKGWKLLDNSGTKSFQTILTGVTYDTVRKDPYYFPAAGNAISDGLSNVGERGVYWSSTRYTDINHAYDLYFNSGTFLPRDSSYRYLGTSVRCVLN